MKTSTSLVAALSLLVAATIFFLAFPEADLAASAVFYQPQAGFAFGNWGWARFMYLVSPWLINVWLVVLAFSALMASWKERLHYLRKPALFLLTVILLGPGLLVNTLKDDWGRARPSEIVEFGGNKQFTPAWIISDQCQRNCSFVSGHASGAFSIMALAWVFPRRRRAWLIAGSVWGTHIGLVRMAQGSHFLSDVVIAGILVYLVADILARWVFYRPAASLPELYPEKPDTLQV